MVAYSVDLSSGLTESFFGSIHQLTNNLVVRKRLTEITIELLQNIKKHGITSTSETLIIKRDHSSFSVQSTNQIRSEDVVALKNKIRFINSLNSVELKKEHTRTLHKTMLSEKSGAGLGLYRIAIRAKSALKTSFKSIDPDHHTFTLHINLTA